MTHTSYVDRRAELKTYFDRTAVDAWARLTSNAQVSGIRATVRAGREEMRRTLLGWLPADLGGARVLDAGCGTGMLAVEAARRGADVVASDLSPTLVELARQRQPHDLAGGRITFHVGDMLEPALGRFDYVVAMDSLIHYRSEDIAAAVARFAERTEQAVLFTYAPRTPALSAMHAVGRLFPKADRAPAIEPVGERTINRALRLADGLGNWAPAREHRVTRGFYMSKAREMRQL